MKLTIYVLAFLFTIGLYAQENSTPISKDIIYAEGGGNSFLYSINYERIFFKKENFQFSARIGFGSYPRNSYYAGGHGSLPGHFQSSWFVIPVEAMFVFGRKPGKFELGLGYTNLITETAGTKQNPADPTHPFYYPLVDYLPGLGLSVMYRYEKPDGGFFLKAGLTGMVFFNANEQYSTVSAAFPWPKLVLGYKFKRCK